MRRRHVWLGLLGIVVGGALTPASATRATPQNQCPGDCSPCLGPSDPFCNGGSGNPPADNSTTCWLCSDVTAPDGTKGGQCVKTNAGQQGFDSCSQTSVGTFPSKCVAAGNSCKVNP